MSAWDIKVFRRHVDDDPDESCPAEAFLNDCPISVALDLIDVIDAVAGGPPPQFRGGPAWQAMHGVMRGIYEARIRGPGGWLYRLFCVLERAAPGLDGPTLVVITGKSKRNESAFSAADYDSVRRLAEEYRARTPRSVV
jgi:hypothetical protein